MNISVQNPLQNYALGLTKAYDSRSSAFSSYLGKELSTPLAAASKMPLSMLSDAQNTMPFGDGNLKSKLLAFCMLLSSGAGSASLGAAISSISAALNKLESGELERYREETLLSDYPRELLSRVNDTFFSKSAKEASTPYNASKATVPAIRSSPSKRSASLYRQVIDQFNVENNPRYAVNKKGTGDTYCNIFLWDVTSAMGAEIPHYIDAKTSMPRTYPNVSGARALNANGIHKWLMQHGKAHGWVQVTAEQAQAYANQGRPAVTAWKNADSRGHAQVVCPSNDGRYNNARGVTIAQAGRKLTSYSPMTRIYSSRLKDVVYFAHI